MSWMPPLLLAAQEVHIADASSGVSWGVLWAVLGVIATLLVGTTATLYRMLDAQGERLAGRMDALDTRLSDGLTKAVEAARNATAKVEADARAARGNAWAEHNSLRDRVTKLEAAQEVLGKLEVR